MTDAIFDTTFFIDYLRGDVAALEVWTRVETGELNGHYSALSLTELWVSPRFNPVEEAIFIAITRQLVEAPLTPKAAELAGMALRQFPREQRGAHTFDALIGSIALVENLPVYTRNVRDMSRFATTVVRY
ncbi:MAG TPA: hypothetical protein PJ994_06640 [Tepidiformaceae bacterium]|nr:hypothetical protein [Tepidiformaceae bacterium]HMO95358.1 hypothetical protein [Tepidiformaceae bacterium]